mmetsp:Transcript_16963/g.32499  ORF Transcript_16963/g.32499 Transcript_16963/m.32499 type:complete len:94 (+) Transcript_16963:186-467(+)|eukprot:CAMPEP_0114239004 /NCGR_PEP_ID=MMETSP0058-20121206/8220_1 /TAXON_ID=36894 /ORGANISM="Pyramimonas parkeae, CCMP726" /LENGTH=93 /DNA_ID=CAMNT_0001351139 /DNA_START=184 /DNA_END=465 /DNA_ORIENTATION=+
MDSKPEAGSSEEHINVKVKSQDGQEVFFKIKKTTPFRKLIDAYCKRQGGDPNQILFLFEGSRLKAEQTPEQVDLGDGDEIDAMAHQTGGRQCN